MNPVEDRNQRLVERLTALTTSGKITWEPTERDGAFIVDLPTGTVVIGYRPPTIKDLLSTRGAELLVNDENGTLIEAFTGDELPRSPRAIDELHRLVRQIALNVPERLDEVIAGLDKLAG